MKQLKIINYSCSYAQRFTGKLYLDCWAGNQKLRVYYPAQGLTYLGYFPEKDYSISVFTSTDCKKLDGGDNGGD
ncbi:hypothetical protein GCM10008986_18550 [Salinibacillus aidingensis]|uniref:Uncharacterized protein n=1 Tax=Salinibacillus aidingensis TaxID=237684 RepID=A0ABP3L5A3_9BACI